MPEYDIPYLKLRCGLQQSQMRSQMILGKIHSDNCNVGVREDIVYEYTKSLGVCIHGCGV